MTQVYVPGDWEAGIVTHILGVVQYWYIWPFVFALLRMSCVITNHVVEIQAGIVVVRAGDAVVHCI